LTHGSTHFGNAELQYDNAATKLAAKVDILDLGLAVLDEIA
jgi:hypothetical protein